MSTKDAKEKIYIYHYHARCSQGHKTTRIDGIVRMKNRIVDQDGYNELKNWIVQDNEA